MSFFADNYSRLTYPIGNGDGERSLRLAQLGAIHSVASHFSMRSDPAVITMPTGSGKTAVLIASALVLRAKRVLIITPSRLVREQIAEEATTLRTLRMAGAVDTVDGPKVFSTRSRVVSPDEWEAMREFDVVVGTVPSISPEYEGIPEPPRDLFDLVLVDEAHHSPARTWYATLTHFSDAKRILFTATPFRQDQREIKGRFIYTYDMRRAFEDGVFGEIAYQPVVPAQNQNPDVAVALASQAAFVADRDRGLNHRIMVRTDSRSRAEELLGLYEANTNLRLRLVTGDKSLRYVKSVIRDLQAGTLDGVVCVNMLGEGFDLPLLKIAAIHSPHRSLAVTLQFIGRFARTAGENIGSATFLAVPTEIEIEAERLYDTRAVWQDIVQNLSAARVQEEVSTREILESFSPIVGSEDLNDLSLFDLEPYFHVKIYQLREAVSITEGVQFPFPMQVVYQGSSEEHGAAIYITREISQPRWATDDRLSSYSSDLFVLFQHPDSLLLFICASRRSAGIYESVASTFSSAVPRPIPLARLNRVLNDITSPEFFNVGMRNRVAANTTESYRIVTGSSADKSISKSDGRLFHAGHAFGRGNQDGDPVTIGLSSSSKVWSNRADRIPALIEWCATLAERISKKGAPRTMSGMDILDVGEEIEKLPEDIVAAEWPAVAYRATPMCRYQAQGADVSGPLLDFDLRIDPAHVDAETVALLVRHDGGYAGRIKFGLGQARLFEWADAHQPALVVLDEHDAMDLVDYLNDEPPTLYTAELNALVGTNYLSLPADDNLPFEVNQIEPTNWQAHDIDIQVEFGPAPSGRVSIHDGLESILVAGDAQLVYYDHGSGEMADFVTASVEGGRLVIRLYHCKGSSGEQPGHRVGDIYEVVSQATKSVVWALKQRVVSHVRRRFGAGLGGARFAKGDLDTLETLVSAYAAAQIDYEFIAVQPGLKKDGLPPKLAHVLAASDDHLRRGGFRMLRVMASE